MLLLVLAIATLAGGWPVMDDDSEMEDTSPYTGTTKLTLIDSGVNFGWIIGESGIEMSLKLSHEVTWLIIGFNKIPYGDTSAEDLALIYIKHKGTAQERLLIRTVHMNRDGSLVGSAESYETGDIQGIMGGYQVSFSRVLKPLPWNRPLKLIWNSGPERSMKKIRSIFKQTQKSTTVQLDQPNSIKLSGSTPFGPIPEENTDSSPKLTHGFVSENTNQPTSTVITNAVEENMEPKTGLPKMTKVSVEENINPKTGQDLTEQSSSPPVAGNAEKSQNVFVQQHNKSKESHVAGTPCPTPKCNCALGNSSWVTFRNEPTVHRQAISNPPCTSAKPSHWWEDMKNSVYMAIIGAAALCTGMIVLCIACCCARSKRSIPRTRKHKVAFYKVNDFDSANEEIEFLKEDSKNST